MNAGMLFISELRKDIKSQTRWTISSVFQGSTHHIDFHIAQRRLLTILSMLLFTAILLLVSFVVLRSEANWIWLAWALYILGAMFILVNPAFGLYLIVFLTLAGDNILTPTYPFTKNFSSAESIFYINDKLIVSALEVYLILAVISWLLRGIGVFAGGRLEGSYCFSSCGLWWA
jgi:hypothetical protein